MELEKQCPLCGTAFIISPDCVEQSKPPRKKNIGNIIHLVPKRELTINDIRCDEGTFIGGGSIFDYPLPKQPSIKLLREAQAAIIEYLRFYSLEVSISCVFENLFGDPDAPEAQVERKENAIADVRACIEQSIVKLWEICMLILNVKEETAMAEYKRLMGESQDQPDFDDPDIPF